ncbi:MAG: DUF4328 domain-containing protein [Actinomycetia bacterium]|nr:DUF4328 domain-containing protein [Actinomycetes bacterium]MCH9700672.1 DUF4328 domain-containing protein [Actinomycetes bacterium]MCH9760813.1 DUF4328 domain-containing protein [Actinomycetes bacterium]
MIQVCSQCGTRWNVRNRQRAWCPRCKGTLLPPSSAEGQAQWGREAPAQPGHGRPGPLLPPGYRWVAVRPGAPPPPRRGSRELGPTPRYSSIPRWGLVERFDAPTEQEPVRGGPSIAAVRATLVATMSVLAAAAFLHLVRYVLLIVNRTVLLNPWVAGAATWGGVAVSVVAMFMVVASVLVLTNWLTARRSAAFRHLGRQDPRSVWELRAGCLVPVVNLVWAPVYVIELAKAEDRLRGLRRPIVVWWLAWAMSTGVSIFSIATSFTTDPQGIANNTVTTIVAYLLALAALLLAREVLLGFERQPVERPATRWVVVADASAPGEPPESAEPAEPAAAVESKGQDPAA